MKKLDCTYKIYNIFLCFLFYSFMGWIIETIYMSIYHGHLVKRGFLIEPLCVVYGIATVLVVYTFSYIKLRPLMLFLYSSLLATIVELAAGLLLETLLPHRLWDYSERFANFMGYICLRNTIIWGILSLFVVYIIHPRILKAIAGIPLKTKELFCYFVVFCFSIDITISIYTSLQGMNNISWLSQVFSEKLEQLQNVTSKVVYNIRH